MNLSPKSSASHDLSRFVEAQQHTFATALRELTEGRKRTHWMWFIFPQIQGLGTSSMARRYAIESRAEAESYLRHPLLARRLIQCSNALLGVTGKSAHEIMGSPDDLKLRSSMTLFASVREDGSVFHQVIERYFQGDADQRTLDILADPNHG